MRPTYVLVGTPHECGEWTSAYYHAHGKYPLHPLWVTSAYAVSFLRRARGPMEIVKMSSTRHDHKYMSIAQEAELAIHLANYRTPGHDLKPTGVTDTWCEGDLVFETVKKFGRTVWQIRLDGEPYAAGMARWSVRAYFHMWAIQRRYERKHR